MEVRSKTMRVSGKHGVGDGGTRVRHAKVEVGRGNCGAASRNLSPTH